MTIVQNPQQFLEDFAQQAKKAQKRICLQSMLFEYGEALAKLEPILISKAKEGVDVQINADWVSQRYSEGNPNIIPPLWGPKRKRMLDIHHANKLLINRLTDAGVKIIMINQPKLPTRIISIFRRNHKKLYIVDDTAWLGGVNLFDLAFKNIDLMVKFTDPSFAELATHEFYKVDDNKSNDNYRIAFRAGYELLVDTGVIGRSLIYDEAIGLIRQAKESVVFISQFVPEGKLLDSLLEASERNIAISVITSPRSHQYFTKFPYKIPYHRFLSRIKNSKQILFSHQDTMTHAKLLIVDGESAIFGSHNLISTGGTLGTEEIAIKTEHKELLKQLEEFVNKNTTVKVSKDTAW